jgi:hypothetical protein
VDPGSAAQRYALHRARDDGVDMISFVMEMVVGKIVGLFMSQRWHMAILYSLALLALVVLTIGVPGYLFLNWLFRPDDFKSPLTVVLSLGALAFVVALWVAFSVLQRRVFR